MANVPVNSPSFKLGTTAGGTNTYVLGSDSRAQVGTYTVQIVDAGSLSVSIVVKARSLAAAKADPATPFLAWYYLTAAGAKASAALVAAGIVVIPTHGLQIALDVTFTSGTGIVYATETMGHGAV